MTVDEIALVIGEAVETADHAVRTTPFPAPDAAQGYQMTQSALIRELSVHRLLPGSTRGPPPRPGGRRPAPHRGHREGQGLAERAGAPPRGAHQRAQPPHRAGNLVRPGDGCYAFEGIRGDVAYTTLAYDYTGNYRACWPTT
jgi:hypothetical protein